MRVWDVHDFGVNGMKNKIYLLLYNNLGDVGRIFFFFSTKGWVEEIGWKVCFVSCEEVSCVITVHVHLQLSSGIDFMVLVVGFSKPEKYVVMHMMLRVECFKLCANW